MSLSISWGGGLHTYNRAITGRSKTAAAPIPVPMHMETTP